MGLLRVGAEEVGHFGFGGIAGNGARSDETRGSGPVFDPAVESGEIVVFGISAE